MELIVSEKLKYDTHKEYRDVYNIEKKTNCSYIFKLKNFPTSKNANTYTHVSKIWLQHNNYVYRKRNFILIEQLFHILFHLIIYTCIYTLIIYTCIYTLLFILLLNKVLIYFKY